MNCNRSKHPHNALQCLINRNLKTFSTSQSIYFKSQLYLLFWELLDANEPMFRADQWSYTRTGLGKLGQQRCTGGQHWWTAAVEASKRAASLLSRLPSRQLTIDRARTGFPLSTEQGEIYFHSWPEFENTCLDKSLRLVGGLEKRWWWMIVEECCQPSKCRPPSTGCQKSGLCNSWSNKPMPVSILYLKKTSLYWREKSAL